MYQFRCDQCHRTHNRSSKCLYCGAGRRYQKPVTPEPTASLVSGTVSTETPLPSPAPSVMTDSQRRGMVKFHERAAIAYEASGQTEQAAAARARAESLQAEAEQVTT